MRKGNVFQKQPSRIAMENTHSLKLKKNILITTFEERDLLKVLEILDLLTKKRNTFLLKMTLFTCILNPFPSDPFEMTQKLTFSKSIT